MINLEYAEGALEALAESLEVSIRNEITKTLNIRLNNIVSDAVKIISVTQVAALRDAMKLKDVVEISIQIKNPVEKDDE